MKYRYHFIMAVCTAIASLIYLLGSNLSFEENTTESEFNDENLISSPTEQYRAQIDRVVVVFEHYNYTTYRLKTNDLVREGELNTERGYKDDNDATVFVLNWQKPEGEQMRYIRLTDEPDKLYLLDSTGEIIMGGALILE